LFAQFFAASNLPARAHCRDVAADGTDCFPALRCYSLAETVIRYFDIAILSGG
jgi:hypothetical protein